MSDSLRTSKELLSRLVNRLGNSNKDDKINPDKPSVPEDSKSLSDSGENMEHDVMAGEHWIYRGKRNALILGESIAGKVNDVMSLSAVGLTASKEAAGALAGKVNDVMSQSALGITASKEAAGALAGKVNDVMSLSAVGIAASKEAAGTLAAGIESKAYGLWTSNAGFNLDKDRPDGPNDDRGTYWVEAGLHWLKTPIGRKVLLYGGAAVAGAGAVAATPMVLGAAGFGTTEVAAGSLGAGMMSKAAVTGLGAGMISTLQSAGAAGIAGSTKLIIGGGVATGVLKAAEKLGENESSKEDVPRPPMPPGGSNTGTTATAESATETTNKDKIPLSRL